MVEPDHGQLSIERQCELLGLARSSVYYQPVGETCYNLQLMRVIDEVYTAHPMLGVRRMTHMLRREGHAINHKRVYRLMRFMGLQAIYPKPRPRVGPGPALRYPNLLKGRHIDRPNQAWCSDITYIRMDRGFAYLVAVMDWYSRYILSWTLSNTQDASVCVETYKDALTISQPEIFHSDQGSQFTSEEMTSLSKRAGIQISMCGRGRCYDNILIERLWRSVKYEEVYLNEYANLRQARRRLGGYISFYNHSRPHQSLRYRTPSEVYHGHSGPHPAMAITHTTTTCPLGPTCPAIPHNPGSSLS